VPVLRKRFRLLQPDHAPLVVVMRRIPGHQNRAEGAVVLRRRGNPRSLPSLLDRRSGYSCGVARDVQVSPGGVYDIGLHVVWCPKYRRPVLTGLVATRLRNLLNAKATEHEWQIVACEVMPDHVHLFVKTRPKDSPSFVANQFKGMTSRALRAEFPHLRSRMPTLWSRSFFVASVGVVSAASVQRYIDTQYERPWRKERAR
jgi:putative transposase